MAYWPIDIGHIGHIGQFGLPISVVDARSNTIDPLFMSNGPPNPENLTFNSNSINSDNPRAFLLGIDPGFTGALAVISCLDGQIRLEIAIDMPVCDSKLSSGKFRPILNLQRINALIKIYPISLAVCEAVHAAPDQGVVSMFRFGEQLGSLKGLLVANNIRSIYPAPSVWKASMGVSADKASSMGLAKRLIGIADAQTYLARKKDHGRAEAILLAAFGLRSLNIPHARAGGAPLPPESGSVPESGENGGGIDSII